jgi:uncharacterized protein YndB with AHSA1/START domain
MLGQLSRAHGRWQLEFTRQLPHPPEKVWRALTEPEHLAAWFPTEIEGERAAGAALRFVFRRGEGPPSDGEMLAYDPPRLLEYRWGEEVLRFELRPSADGTELAFTNTFDELGKAARDAAGWHTCLELLESDLVGAPAAADPTERWRHWHHAYLDALGPEAATIGPPQPA